MDIDGIVDNFLGKKKGKKGGKGASATLPGLSTGTSAASRTTTGASSSSSNQHLTNLEKPTQKRVRADSQDE